MLTIVGLGFWSVQAACVVVECLQLYFLTWLPVEQFHLLLYKVQLETIFICFVSQVNKEKIKELELVSADFPKINNIIML